MLVNVKKGFILFMCTILLVFNISATCIKPLTVKATGAEVVVLGGATVEGISLLLDLIAAGLVSIGAYELYENDERMQIVIDSYVDTLTDPTTGIFSPDRTWGDTGNYNGTHVQDPNTGEWVLNPDVVPTADKPVILSPEEQEKYGVSSNYYENAKDLMWEIWQNKHGSGSGGGSGGGDDSGGSDTGNDKGTLVKIGSGVIASISAFLASITSGETGNETIDSWVSEYADSIKYTGTLEKIGSIVTISMYGSSGDYYLNFDDTFSGTLTLECDRVGVYEFQSSDNRYHQSFKYILNGTINTYTPEVTRNVYDKSGNLTNTQTANFDSAGVPCSVNIPKFSSSDALKSYLQMGNDSDCTNKEEQNKLVWADMNTLSKAIPSTLSAFSTLPEGKAIKATALKDYVNDMTNYKTTATPSDLSNPDTQTQTATQTAQQTVQKNTVDTKTDTGEEEEDKPIFIPPSTTPIDIDGSDATRDWRLVFPFCIPFDLIDLYKVLVAEPKAPYWEIPLKVDSIGFEYTFIIDFEQFETLAEIFRLCETIGFILGLALITGKVIKW